MGASQQSIDQLTEVLGGWTNCNSATSCNSREIASIPVTTMARLCLRPVVI